MIYNNIKNNKGYTLLFAVLVSALVLSVGISILNIGKKEFLLASSARESVTAFYAADTGIECAAFYDSDPQNQFVNVNYPGGFSANSINCGILTVDSYMIQSGAGQDTFTFDMKLENNSCAIVEVIKITWPVNTTNIRSSGYNMGWNDGTKRCTTPSPRRVERVLYYSYSY